MLAISIQESAIAFTVRGSLSVDQKVSWSLKSKNDTDILVHDVSVITLFPGNMPACRNCYKMKMEESRRNSSKTLLAQPQCRRRISDSGFG